MNVSVPQPTVAISELVNEPKWYVSPFLGEKMRIGFSGVMDKDSSEAIVPPTSNSMNSDATVVKEVC